MRYVLTLVITLCFCVSTADARCFGKRKAHRAQAQCGYSYFYSRPQTQVPPQVFPVPPQGGTIAPQQPVTVVVPLGTPQTATPRP